MRLKIIAFMLVYLVVLLPFYISSVFADDNYFYGVSISKGINENGGFGKVSRIDNEGVVSEDYRINLMVRSLRHMEVYGLDEINGYLREEDQLTIEITAINDGNEISPDQVKLNSNLNFSSCGIGIEGYVCSLTWPSSGNWSFSGSEDFVIGLYDGSRLLTSSPGQVRVDDRNPTVTSFDTGPELGSGDREFSYSVEDYDYSGSNRYCSGLKKIEFYESDLEGSLIDTIVFDERSCSENGAYSYSTSTEGDQRVCAIVYDNFDQVSSAACDRFTVDTTAPEISDVGLFNSDGYEIEYIKNRLQAVVIANISADDLDEDSVRADLSSLNSAYDDQRADYVGGSSAEWDVEIRASADIDAEITIYLSDLAGNNVSEQFDLSIGYDNSGPVIASLTTNISYNGSYYVKRGLNTFYADVSDSESGLGEVILNIQGRSIIGNCTEGCVWENVSISGGSLAVSVDASDKLGNRAERYSATLLSDTTNPADRGISITAIGGEDDFSPGYTTTGDNFYIVASFSDANGIANVYADLSNFIDGASAVEGSCSLNGSVYQCTWTTGSIDISGYISDDVTFTVIDNLGNTMTTSRTVEVFGLDDEANPNYWSSSVSCSPKMIDREVASLVNTKVYCHVDLSGSAETLEMGIVSCSDTLNNSLAYVANYGLINSQAGSTDPYLMVEFVSDPMRISGLGFSCTMAIFSRVGDNIMTNPEYENVSVSVGFYNMPLGELSDSVQEKIDEAKDIAWYLGDWIDILNQILFYGEKICQIANTIAKVWLFIGEISVIWDGIAKGFAASPDPTLSKVAAVEVDAARTQLQAAQAGLGADALKENWVKHINKICKFFSCRLFFDEVWGLQNTNIGQSIGRWQRDRLENFDWVATGFGSAEGVGIGGDRGIHAYDDERTGMETIITKDVLNPKDSIIISVVTLCLPGIIYNLNKLRQIQCMYADCMQNYVQQGLPLKACEDAKHYATCKYWYGEIFQLLPFTGLVSFFDNVIKNALASPLHIVDAGIGIMCMDKVQSFLAGELAYICLLNDLMGLIADVWADIEGYFGEGAWDIQNYCDRLDDDEDEEEEEDEEMEEEDEE